MPDWKWKKVRNQWVCWSSDSSEAKPAIIINERVTFTEFIYSGYTPRIFGRVSKKNTKSELIDAIEDLRIRSNEMLDQLKIQIEDLPLGEEHASGNTTPN